MQTQTIKSLMKSGVLELGLVTASLLVFGHFLGVHARPNLTPLQALQEGDYDALRQTLDAGTSPNIKDDNGTPLLMNAVLYGDAEFVRLLLNHGAEPNATNAAGATALIWAAGDPKKANLLIEYGANVNARSALGRTPLLVASSVDGAGGVVKTLIQHGADTKAVDELKGNPRLMTGGGMAPAIVEAAKARDGAALRELLKQPGIDVNAKDNNGGTALTEALINGNRENARLLLTKGASIKVQVSMSGFTPLILAAMRGDAELVELMLRAGAEVNDTDASGTTALMWAAYAAETAPSRAVDLLLQAGADVSTINLRGESALTMARWHGASTPTVERLSMRLSASN